MSTTPFKEAHYKQLESLVEEVEAGNEEHYIQVACPGYPPVGPISKHKLKAWLHQNNVGHHLQLKDKYDHKWFTLFEHKDFQRRKSTHHTNVEVSEKTEIYILVDGKKTGPYNLQEVQEGYEERKVLATDLISIDNGLTWNRLYQIKNFDRRALNHENLPGSPREKIFNQSKKEVDGQILKANKKIKSTDALANLAFVDHKKNEKQQEKQEASLEEAASETAKKSSHQTSEFGRQGQLAVGLVGLMLFLGVFLKLTPQSQTKARKPAQSKQEKQQKVQVKKNAKNQPSAIKTPVKRPVQASSTPSRPSIKRQTPPPRRPVVRTPAPVAERRDERDRDRQRDQQRERDRDERDNYDDERDPYEEEGKKKLSDNPKNDDEDSYDDGQEPINDDPIRRKAANEIVNPDESYFDREETDDYDRSPSSGGDFDEYDEGVRENLNERFDTYDQTLDEALEGEYYDE